MRNKFLGGENMEIAMNEIESKVNEVLKHINIEDDRMIDTDEIKKAVEKLAKNEIKVFSFSFKENLGPKFDDCGAITQLLSNEGTSSYNIILNSDKDVKYQRFSLVHEFGHIILNAHNFREGDFVASFHIDYKLNHISNSTCELNPSLENEEKANIFALLVLMPNNEFLSSVRKYNLETVAKIFGVTLEAVLSRYNLLVK